MTAIRRLQLGSIVLGGALVASLLIAEVLVRVVAPQPPGLTHQDSYGLALHYPSITRFLPQYGHAVSFNSAGMRDREHALEKPPGVFRVLVLGDSFMEAVQVPFESSLPAILERDLAARTGMRVEVINAGVSGWGTDDALRFLERYGLAYAPDLVVVAMTLHNDVSDNLREAWHTIQGGRLVDKQVPPLPSFEYAKLRVKAFLAVRSHLVQLWRKVRYADMMDGIARDLDQHVLSMLRTTEAPDVTRGLQLTRLLLGAIADSVKQHGGSTAVVVLPIIHQLSDSALATFASEAKLPPSSLGSTRPQDRIRPIADSLGLQMIDLLPEFRRQVAQGRSLYIEWDGHWNASGHRVAASVIVDSLVAHGLRPATR